MKVYTSKLGLKFSIVPFNKPHAGEVVFFTQSEWDWIKKQNLKPEEFKAIWFLKRDNYQYDPIPVEETKQGAIDTVEFAKQVIESIWGKK